MAVYTRIHKSFSSHFWAGIKNDYDYTPELLSYEKAHDIFDLLTVASINNASSTSSTVTAEQLSQLRTLADSAEFGTNYNRTMPARSIGGASLLGGILTQLNQTISSKGKLKFSLLTGSYDNFIASFGLLNLTSASTDFFGLPLYASSMSFELFTAADMATFPANIDDLNVRFLFRNGSDAGSPLTVYPLFGGDALSLSWRDFALQIEQRAITSVGRWCAACGATQSFCPAPSTTAVTEAAVGSSGGGMSNAVAGAVGAVVTVGVALWAGFVVWLVRRRRGVRGTDATSVEAAPRIGKTKSLESGST